MATPVQIQYSTLKKEHPDAILFFQLGDFFELFYEDARVGSRILGIQLTARHKGTDSEMAMCGFPIKAYKEYLETLINNGYKVAIAEQVVAEDGKTITRKINRVVTPGTTLDEGVLEPEKNSYLVSIGKHKGAFGLAYTDVSTGEFRTAGFGTELEFLAELYRLSPTEILIPTVMFEDEDFCKKLPKSHLTPRTPMSGKKSEKIIKEKFGVQTLDGFGLETLSLLIDASAMIFVYLQETQKNDLDQIQNIVRYHPGDYMTLDPQTFRHLEVFEPLQYDEKAATLLSVFERPCTPMGGRQVRNFLLRPLLQIAPLRARQSAVEEIYTHREIRMGLYNALETLPDIERVLSRIGAERGNGRDLAFVRDALRNVPQVAAVLTQCQTELLQSQATNLQGFDPLQKELEVALKEQPGTEITTGGIFADGYNAELDGYRNMMREADTWKEEFLEKQKEATGITNLRLKYSKNFGFTLEVSTSQAHKAPEHWQRRQTLVNAERFTTSELTDYETNVLSAEEKACILEHQLFHTIKNKIIDQIEALQEASKALGLVDGLLVFARTAIASRWVKPEVSDTKQKLVIEEGRHPVVEVLAGQFIANGLHMDTNETLHLITGPNMAGKSTYLRQNALIILLAQCGSFVPAKKVTMGLYDTIFTRVGASDNVSAGKSTFYTEMFEAAHILRSATERSFIILDEIGRGTSTFDGISLAWAITEHLHNTIQAQVLFATHYHELIDLAESLPRAKNYHVSVAQAPHGIVFLRKIIEGGISDSFGIEVAKIAGVPENVITKAREVLQQLESEEIVSNIGQPSLFGKTVVKEVLVHRMSEIEKKIKDADLDGLSPREAWDMLHQLKNSL